MSFRDPAECASCVGGIDGRGKRGGLRVIYYARTRQGHIGMVTLSVKNVMENISAKALRQIKDEIDG